MTKEDAIQWLTKRKTMRKDIPLNPPETYAERVIRANAALAEQAYWTLKAHAEGLIETAQQS